MRNSGAPISIHALRRYAGTASLKRHLEKPDFGEERTVRHTFESVPVFGLVQMDGCTARYIRIRDSTRREKGLDLETARLAHEANKRRYETYEAKIRLPRKARAKAIFDASLLDCDRRLQRTDVAPCAAFEERTERK